MLLINITTHLIVGYFSPHAVNRQIYAEVKDKDINLAWIMPSDQKRGIVGGVSGVLSEHYHGSADDQVMAHAHNREGDGEVQMTAEDIKAEEDFVVRYRNNDTMCLYMNTSSISLSLCFV